MVIENRTVRLIVVSLLVLLLIPLLVIVAMMMFGGGMMSQMGETQMGGMHMSAGLMALCVLWALLVSAALIALIVVLVRGTQGTAHGQLPSSDMRPLPH